MLCARVGLRIREIPDCRSMTTPHLDTHMNVDKKLYDMNDTNLIDWTPRGQTFFTFVAEKVRGEQ